MSEERRERRRRAWRTSLLLASILCIVCAASTFVYHGGMQVLRERGDEELTYQAHSSRVAVQDRLEKIVVVLELLARQEHNRSILSKDPDDEIGKALRTTLDHSDSFARIACIDVLGEVVASTDYRDLGSTVDLPLGSKQALMAGGRAYASRDGRFLSVTVPVSYRLDEVGLMGFLHAKVEFTALLIDQRVSISRITSAEGEVLAEHEVPKIHAVGREQLVDHVHAWGSPDLAVRTAPIDMPPGLNDPQWTMAVAECNPELLVEASVLKELVVLLSSGTAGLVFALVLLFSRFEGRLFNRLADRARELGVLNEKLDRSRSDLVKAARIAGMSEVATGILHNVGNSLNSLAVAAGQATEALRTARLSKLNDLVLFLDRDGNELAATIRGHSKGNAFLVYLSELTHLLDSDHGRAREELVCVRTCIDQIQTLVSSQQQFVTQSSFREPTPPCELMEGALFISNLVLGAPDSVRIERDFEDLPDVLVEKHRVIEILVNLINNARHSLDAAQRPESLLCLRVRASTERALLLQVSDNGVGIPAENMDKIFNHGFSTRPGGNGFGLHASINAARALGGSLEAESPGSGRGATFTLDVPVELAPAS